jgi:transposase
MPPVLKQPKKTPADEVSALHQALLAAEKKHADLQQMLAAKDQHIVHLYERIHLLLIQRFGCRSDTVPVTQLGLFNEAEELAAEVEEPVTTTVASHTRTKKGRRPLPEDLPRVEVIHDIDDKTCPHDGTTLKSIGEAVSEQLDIVPAKVQVIRHIRKKYDCPCCESHLVTAKKPPQMIEKSNASAGFLAWMIQGNISWPCRCTGKASIWGR